MCLLWGGLLRSEEISVSGRVDSERIGEQDQLQFTIDISGPDAGKVNTINLPAMKNLKVVAGPSVSTRFQWVNGVSSSSKSFTYILLPTSKGEAEIPAVEVQHEGKRYRTDPIKIEVISGSITRRESQRIPTFPDIVERKDDRARPEPDIIARATVDKDRLYQGEQLTLTYKLYTTVNILDIDISDMPSFEGFWVEDLKVDPERSARLTEMEGKRYYEYTLMKKLLFPTTPGTKTIKPLTLAVTARGRGGSIFDSPFFDNPIRMFRKTGEVNIDVLQLPETGIPDSFSGAVGDFTLSVQADRKECSVNDAVSVRVAVEGTGNLKGVAAPGIAEVPDFKIYDPKISEEVKFEGERLKSKKIWDYIFIPLTPGEHLIPGITFSFFDPSRKTYRVTSSSELPLVVRKGQIETQPTTIVQKGDITPVRSDINFIKPLRGEIRDERSSFYKQRWFFIILFIPVLITPAYIVLSFRRERVRSDLKSARLKKASKIARKTLRRARKLVNRNDMQQSLQEISKAVAGYVADKFDQSASGLTYERIEELLESKGIEDAAIRRFLVTLERCDFTRFSKSMMSAEEVKRLLDEAETSISELEKII